LLPNTDESRCLVGAWKTFVVEVWASQVPRQS
jgi:hypothetical protein